MNPAYISYQLAQETFRMGYFVETLNHACGAISAVQITREQFLAWLNPLPAIEINNQGNWREGWNASCEAINPRVTDEMIVFIKSCQISLEASSHLSASKQLECIKFTDSYLEYFAHSSIEQRVDRIFIQLEWSRQNIIFSEDVDPESACQFSIEQSKFKVEEAVRELTGLINAIKRAREVAQLL